MFRIASKNRLIMLYGIELNEKQEECDPQQHRQAKGGDIMSKQ